MNELNIFSAALEISDSKERDQYLDQACGEQPGLRARLEALLRHTDNSAQFLERPPAALVATQDQQIVVNAGSQIGPYKLLEEIGEGGMGTVWVAQQSEPIKRQVAIKLIKAGMDSKVRCWPASKPNARRWP